MNERLLSFFNPRSIILFICILQGVVFAGLLVYRGWKRRSVADYWLARYVRSAKVDGDLFRHLSFYDDELKRGLQNGLPSSQFQPRGDGLLRVLGDPPCRPLQPTANNFRGRAFVIADATNASASFQFLRAVRENRLATIVGQTSGGNLQGINGDGYALLSLPNSRFEIDIPLYFQSPPAPQPDAGVAPDWPVEPDIEDIAAGVDTELNYVLKRRRYRRDK